MTAFLQPLDKQPLQAYLGSVQLFDLIGEVLEQTGPAEVHVSTFSTSEEFLRRIHRFRQRGLITHATLITDRKAARKTEVLYKFMTSVFDEVRLAQNHSKVVLCLNGTWRVAVCTSQNLTRGNRAEAGVVTTSPAVLDRLCSGYQALYNQAARLHGLQG